MRRFTLNKYGRSYIWHGIGCQRALRANEYTQLRIWIELLKVLDYERNILQICSPHEINEIHTERLLCVIVELRNE